MCTLAVSHWRCDDTCIKWGSQWGRRCGKPRRGQSLAARLRSFRECSQQHQRSPHTPLRHIRHRGMLFLNWMIVFMRSVYFCS